MGITAGPDGNLWFTSRLGTDGIGMINPTTDAISRVRHSHRRFRPRWDHGGPRRQPLVHRVSRRQDRSRSTRRPTPSPSTPIPYAGSSPDGITTGPDGNLWFTDPGTNAIGVATLTTSQLVVTQQPPASVTAGSPSA